MTQNFSEMSDMFVPELIELDSYWRKAVEDAICDTLKGERRLHYALRNRKKINQKLESLGLKAGRTQLTLANRLLREDVSASSVEEDASKKGQEPPGSNSCSRTFRETPPSEKKYKSPDRPLLGDGSLEKMKKSQNSFNCEPMGEDLMDSLGDDCESEKDDEGQLCADEANKKIQWLHVREDTEFDDSDSESSSSAPAKDDMVKSGLEEFSSLRESPAGKRQNDKRDWLMQAQKTDFWDVKDENSARSSRSLDQKLQVALAKRKIVNSAMRGSLSGRKVEVSASGAQVVGRRRKGASGVSAFIQLYLEVYRELFRKCSPKQIEAEAAKRWWSMTAKQKSKYANKKFSK